MKGIVAAAAVLGAIAASASLALAATSGQNGSLSVASPSAAERTFVHWLATHHPGFQGPSVCPTSRFARETNGGIRCVAEIHKGRRYIQVWGRIRMKPEIHFVPAFRSVPWTRRWSKYARPPQHVSPGLISVNATHYDWRWLVLGVDYLCRQKHRESCTAPALDGQWDGYGLFFNFTCHVDANLISCRNKLGDGLRWLPNAH
jgi:hypothetical protein